MMICCESYALIGVCDDRCIAKFVASVEKALPAAPRARVGGGGHTNFGQILSALYWLVFELKRGSGVMLPSDVNLRGGA